MRKEGGLSSEALPCLNRSLHFRIKQTFPFWMMGPSPERLPPPSFFTFWGSPETVSLVELPSVSRPRLASPAGVLWGMHTPPPPSTAGRRAGIKRGLGVSCLGPSNITGKGGRERWLSRPGTFSPSLEEGWRWEQWRWASESQGHSPGTQDSVLCHFSDCPGHHSATTPPNTVTTALSALCASAPQPHPATSSYTCGAGDRSQ